MQIGIAAYLRNVAVRCAQISKACPDRATKESIDAICVELADKAAILEEAFRITPSQPRSDE